MINDMGEAHHQVFSWSVLTRWNWMLSTPPISHILSAVSPNKGPALFLEYGKKHIQVRQALKKTDPVTYHSEKARDMLYWFMEGRQDRKLSASDILTVRSHG